MKTNTHTHRQVVMLHKVAYYRPDGTAVSLCGLTLRYGADSVRPIIEKPDTITQECPLCQAAEIVDGLTAEDLFNVYPTNERRNRHE